LPEGLSPAVTPAAMNPRGAVMPPSTGRQAEAGSAAAGKEEDTGTGLRAGILSRTGQADGLGSAPVPPTSLLGSPAAPRQRRIGLTGGIATGKSTAASLLGQRFGLPVLDADAFARQALEPGTAALAAVLARYGEGVRRPDGSLDRAALGTIVFSRPAERRWLEELVHPIVRRRFDAELERLAGAPTVVLMIPLLFEAGLEHLCSEVWVVHCDEAEQLRRLVERDGLGAAEARARLASQWPQARKLERADVVIDNRGTMVDLIGQLERALSPSASR